jgi:hypothetical protein
MKMEKKQLLREWIALDYTSELIKESRDKNGGKLMLQGIIQKSDQLNQNKRVYPNEILRREVENYQKAVRDSRAVGELDHPESSSVSLERVSHIIKEMKWEGNNVIGRIEVLPTPRGKILETLLESGVKIGISSRGVGSTDKNNEGYDVVQPDYQIICFDIVSEPSTPGAYLFAEGKQIDVETKRLFTRGDRIFRALNDIVLKG